jgi:hypothetical protein
MKSDSPLATKYNGRNDSAVCIVVDRHAVIAANNAKRGLFTGNLEPDAASDALRFPTFIRPLRRTTAVITPIGSKISVPCKPYAVRIMPATSGPRKKPVLPPAMNMLTAPPLPGPLDLTTVEKAGG